MKRMTLMALLLLTACSNEVSVLTAADLAPGLGLNDAQLAALEDARKVCPGLDDYSPDLRVVKIDVPAIAEPIIFAFDIPGKPQHVPDTFKAWGQHCEIELDDDRASASKRVCASACLRRPFDGDGPPYILN